MNIVGPFLTMCGILSGPANEPTSCTSLYDGFGAGWLVNENGRVSHAELPSRTPKPPLYSERVPRRLLPNAASCANGEAAPLLTLPLTSNPSAAPSGDSLGGGSAAGAVVPRAAAGGAEAVTSAR